MRKGFFLTRNAGSVVVKCFTCGKEFKTTPDRSRRTDRQTCSRICCDKMKGMRRIEENQKPCVFCGKMFFAKHKTKKYCGLECRKGFDKANRKKVYDDCSVTTDNRYLRLCSGKYKNERLHRHIAKKYFGDEAVKGMVVHHIDGNRLNNEIENLQLMTNKEHVSLHSKQQAEKRKEKRRQEILSAGGDPEAEKKCSKCKKIMPFNFFTKTSRDSLSYSCKECQKKARSIKKCQTI